MKEEKKIEELIKNETWKDDLIMCPSQCELLFEYKNIEYCIYLRWRWSHPWTATLIENNRGTKEKWIELDVNDYSHDELDKIKNEAIESSIEYLIQKSHE